MVIFYFEGYEVFFVVMFDEKGNFVIFYFVDGIWLERLVRILIVEMGGSFFISDYNLSGV